MRGLVEYLFDVLPAYLAWARIGVIVVYVGYTVVVGFCLYTAYVLSDGTASVGDGLIIPVMLLAAPLWVPVVMYIKYATRQHVHMN